MTAHLCGAGDGRERSGEESMAMLAQHFMVALLVGLCALLIVLEYRCRLEPSFISFGVTCLVLTAFSAIDIWFQPLSHQLTWTVCQHVLASFFPPLIYWHLVRTAGRPLDNTARMLFWAGGFFAIMFMSGVMLRRHAGDVRGSLLYGVVFAPYVTVVVVGLPIRSLLWVREAPAERKGLLRYNLFGLALLSAFGVLDLLIFAYGSVRWIKTYIPGFTVLGTLAYGLFMSSVLVGRLARLVEEREAAHSRLTAAYRELEEVQLLKELGQSSAAMNHEIRNLMYSMGAHAHLLTRERALSGDGRRAAEAIRRGIDRVYRFSQDVLQFSRLRLGDASEPFCPAKTIDRALDLHFGHERGRFGFEDHTTHSTIVSGAEEKMEHVVVNLCRNALQAGAQRTAIRLHEGNGRMVMTVDDNGRGCTAEQLPLLFNAFYTTNRRGAGTGLGLSLVRSIVEQHGGHISVYSKNLLGHGYRGLTVVVTLPCAPLGEEYRPSCSTAFVIQEGIEDLTGLTRVLHNAGTKVLVRSIDQPSGMLGAGLFFVSQAGVATARDRIKTEGALFEVLAPKGGAPVVRDRSTGVATYLTEERVLIEVRQCSCRPAAPLNTL